MKYCPITYEAIKASESYSEKGLHLLSPKLKNLRPLMLSASEQRSKAIELVGKMSVQGVQKKLSAQFKVQDECFKIVDQQGHYILKPQSEDFPELPENEAITMTLAKTIGIEVPLHGLVYSKDGSMTYFIKRFDRVGRQKRATEDFSQLLGLDRHAKYESSIEKVVSVVMDFCTYPKIELIKLFKIILFSYLVGNEDMHLKNFSLITRDEITTLSPAYDLLNSTIALPRASEEMALPLRGKKRNLTKGDLLEYFAVDRLMLNEKVMNETIQTIKTALPEWQELIQRSFLTKKMQKQYLDLLDVRCSKLAL